MYEDKIYQDYKAIFADMLNDYYQNRYVTFVGDYNSASAIVEQAIKFGFTIGAIMLHDPEYKDYDKEFNVCLYDGKVSCEEHFMGNNRYYSMLEDEYVYLDEKCDKDMLDYCFTENVKICILDDNEWED